MLNWLWAPSRVCPSPEKIAVRIPLHQEDVEYAQTLTPAEIVDRAASVSSIASLPGARREVVLDGFRRLAATHPDLRDRASVTLPYLTKVYWTERR